MSHVSGDRFNLLPRARPSISFDRTVSQPNIKNKFFLSNASQKSRVSRGQILRPQSHVQNLYCVTCKHRKPNCLCVQRELQRTQSFYHTRPIQEHAYEHQPSRERLYTDIARENQAIIEAEKLAHIPLPTQQRTPTPKDRVEPVAQTAQTSQTSQTASIVPRKRTPPPRSSRKRSPLPQSSSRNKSYHRRTRSRSRRRRTRSRSRSRSRKRSHRSPQSSSQKQTSQPRAQPSFTMDYGSSSEEDNTPQFKQVSVTKTAKVERFLQRNAILNKKKHSSSPSKQSNPSNPSNLTEREMRYSVALDQLEKEMSMIDDSPSEKSKKSKNARNVKVIKRNNDRFLFQFSKDSTSSKVDYSKSSKRVVSIDKIWKELLVYYLATFRGDETILEAQLRQDLKKYDYLPSGKFIKCGTFVRYMRKSFSNSKLEPGGFVDKCTKHSVYLRPDSSRGKKKKLNRQDNFIFVYRYDDMNESDVATSAKSNFRIILEGMIK